MNKKEQKNFLEALKTILEQRELKKEELQEYIKDVFEKTFSRDYYFVALDSRDRYKEEEELVEDSEIMVEVDFDNFIFEIKRIWTINNGKIAFEKMFRELSIEHDIVLDKELKDGDQYIETVDLSKISNSKRQQIQQLLIQRSKEKAKEKVFNKYKNLLGTIVTAKVFKVEENFILLRLEEVVVYVSRNELLPKDDVRTGQYLRVLILDINKTAKDSQIVASRTRPAFIEELIKEENDLVKQGKIKIEYLSREYGTKTKIVVSTKEKHLDPIGSIVGVKGSKIKPVINEVHGEIIDVVEYAEDEAKLIRNLFHPAQLLGVYINNKSETKEVYVLVKDSEFLQAIGKRGINVKLVARIIGGKIDIITNSKKDDYDYDWQMFPERENRKSNRRQNNNSSFTLKIKSLDEIIEEGNKIEEEDTF